MTVRYYVARDLQSDTFEVIMDVNGHRSTVAEAKTREAAQRKADKLTKQEAKHNA